MIAGRYKIIPVFVSVLLRKLARFYCRFGLAALGYIHIEVNDLRPENEKHLCKVLVSNHTGTLDTFQLMSDFNLSFVVKDKLIEDPIANNFALAFNSIFVDRFTKKGRRKAVHEIINHVKDESSFPLLIFPEGTTANGDKLIKFQKGAFIPGVPVTCVHMEYPGKYEPYTDNALMNLLWGASKPLIFWRITFVCNYYPNKMERNDPVLYADNVRDVIANFDPSLEVSEHSYDDVYLFDRSHTVPNYLSRDIYASFNMDFEEVKSLFEIFKTYDTTQNDKLSLDEFKKSLESKYLSERSLEKLFDFLDFENKQHLDFIDYCRFYAICNKDLPSAKMEKRQICFILMDQDRDSNFSKENLKTFFAKGEYNCDEILSKIFLSQNISN